LRGLFFILFLSTTVLGQSQDTESISRAFKSADINNISPYLAQTMDMDICGKGGVISNHQAHMLLHHFFKSNPVNSYHILHSSAFDNKKQHVIAEYSTSKGNFTLIYKVEEREGKLTIRQVRIDKTT
jgi:hypothetical protein